MQIITAAAPGAAEQDKPTIKAMTKKNVQIPKKKIAVLQEAVLEKGAEGSWTVKAKAKEALTTLKEHSASLTVYATQSSVEDVKALLDKAEVPYTDVVKMEGDPEFIIAGENADCVREWETWTLSSIGEKLARQEKKPEETQKKFNKSLGAWLHDLTMEG